jgi:hypothetical protein
MPPLSAAVVKLRRTKRSTILILAFRAFSRLTTFDLSLPAFRWLERQFFPLYTIEDGRVVRYCGGKR